MVKGCQRGLYQTAKTGWCWPSRLLGGLAEPAQIRLTAALVEADALQVLHLGGSRPSGARRTKRLECDEAKHLHRWHDFWNVLQSIYDNDPCIESP